MNIDIPPHIAVSQYLRQQLARKRAYRAWFDDAHKMRWGNGRLKGTALAGFAADYRAALTKAGALDVRECGAVPLRTTLSTKGYEIKGTVLWPVALGQDVGTTDGAYTEDILLASRVGMTIKANKVSAHEAPLNFGLAKHATVRLVERRAISSVEAGLNEILLPLMRDTALTLALGIVEVINDGDTWTRTVFVPLADGLVLFTNRIVVAPRHTQDIGWRFSFTQRRYTPTYLKSALVQPIGNAQQSASSVAVGMWFAATYLSSDQLSPAQRRYAQILSDFLKRRSAFLKDVAFDIQFDPDHVSNEAKKSAALREVDEPSFHKVLQALHGGAFRARQREGVGFLLEGNETTRSFRAMLAKTA